MSNEEIELTIVIPAYNEEKRIRKSLEKINSYLSGKDFASEVLVINDGSSDNTSSIVLNSKVFNLRLIENEVNRGKGYSVKRGIMESKGNYIIFSDADLSTPIEETDKILSALQGDYEIAIGSRHIQGSEIKIKQPWYRHLMGRIFNLFVRIIAVPNVIDTQCGFKGFRRDCALCIFNEIVTFGYSFDVEVLYLAYKFGFKIKEVPVIWLDSPTSRINPFIDPLKMFLDVLKIRLKHRNKNFARDSVLNPVR